MTEDDQDAEEERGSGDDERRDRFDLEATAADDDWRAGDTGDDWDGGDVDDWDGDEDWSEDIDERLDDAAALDERSTAADRPAPPELSDDVPEEEEAADAVPVDAPRGGDPGDAGGPDDEGGEAERDDGEESAPLAGLREDVAERREREAETDDEFDELFADVEPEGEAEEDVWEQLESATEPLVSSAETTSEGEVSVVSKRLCHRCPHFADPPVLACEHEGTTIDAEVDTEHFRVVDCPMVDSHLNVE